MMSLRLRSHHRYLACVPPFEGAGGAACEVPTVQLDEPSLGRLRELDPLGKNLLLSRVVSAFEASLQRMLPQLEQAVHTADLATVRLVAHTLKSSASYIGALAMSAMCSRIEVMVREHELAGLAPAVAELLAEAVGVRAALRRLPERQS